MLGYHVAGKQLVIIFQHARHVGAELFHLALEVGVNVGHQTADCIVVEGHAGTASLLKDVENFLTIAESVEEGGRGTQVHAEGRIEQQVRRDTHQLVHDGAHILGTGRDLDLQGVLDTEAHGMTVLLSRQIVETVGKVERLRIGERLAQLLDTPVYITAIDIDFLDNLAVERGAQAQYTVRGRVLRAYVDNKLLGGEQHVRALFEFSVGSLDNGMCHIVDSFVFEANGIYLGIGVVVLAQGITHPVVAQEETPHVGVIDETDSEEVVNLALIQIGRFPKVYDRVEQRIFAVGSFNFYRYLLVVGRAREIIDTAQSLAPVHAYDRNQIVEVQFVTQIKRQIVPLGIGHRYFQDGSLYKGSFRQKTAYFLLYVCHIGNLYYFPNTFSRFS